VVVLVWPRWEQEWERKCAPDQAQEWEREHQETLAWQRKLEWGSEREQEWEQEWEQERRRERARAEKWGLEWAREWARTEAEARVEVCAPKAQVAAPAEAQAAARAGALARARALAQARAQMADEGMISSFLAKALASLEKRNMWEGAYEPTYVEVLADSKIKGIVDSIEPRYHHVLARGLWRHSKHFWLIHFIAPVTRLPPELLQSILSTIIDDASDSPLVLMLVCKHWYTIVTGIWAPLKLGTRTPKDTVTRMLERNQSLLDIFLDTEIDRGDFTLSGGAYEAIFAAFEAISRWRSLVVESFPGQADLPEHLVDSGLQRCSNATTSQLETFKVKCACEMSPLLDRLLRILGTRASPKLTTVEMNSESVISFLVPAYSPIFRSVKVLFLDSSGTHDPVDLLPHLHQLEEFTASHLSLPVYGHDTDLPPVNTLRRLTLRAVSIQWMSGRIFPVLESCALIFPLHRHVLHTFSTTLPNCKHLTFRGYPLDILDGVSAHNIVHLSVTSSGSFNGRGARQLDSYCRLVLGESRLAPRILHISIEATSQAWMNALTLMPYLEELVIGNARPSSLRAKGLQSLIAQPVHTSDAGTKSTPEKWGAPSCPSLRRFGLKYDRWLRPSERFDLIPDCVSIILSRERLNCSLQSFWVWMGSDQEDPLELIEQSRISLKRIERLVNKSGINEQDVWVLVNMRLIEVIFRPPREPFNASSLLLLH